MSLRRTRRTGRLILHAMTLFNPLNNLLISFLTRSVNVFDNENTLGLEFRCNLFFKSLRVRKIKRKRPLTVCFVNINFDIRDKISNRVSAMFSEY